MGAGGAPEPGVLQHPGPLPRRVPGLQPAPPTTARPLVALSDSGPWAGPPGPATKASAANAAALSEAELQVPESSAAASSNAAFQGVSTKPSAQGHALSSLSLWNKFHS